MPELPDITIYVEALERRIVGQRLRGMRLLSPFLLRTPEPAPREFEGRTVQDIRRIGKRIVIGFEDELFLVLHLMIAGRLRWGKPNAKPPGRIGQAALDFETGTVLITEAGTKKRAAMHLVRGEAALAAHSPGGLDVLTANLKAFTAAITRENRTLKRALTDPRLLDGVGNAYSDEILHAARLSPVQRTRSLEPDAIKRLHTACRAVLTQWTDRLRVEFGDRFPGAGDITAFRDGFAAHGRFGQPCPMCGTAIQRIRYAENETNYCPSCQTGGRVLADRSLSRLLREDWPRTMEELEKLPGRG
jgi:formamidopyrimidine-DNA glycosylase